MNQHEKVIARDRDHLLQLIEEAFEEEGENCDLNFIDVSQVTDMHDLFADRGFRGNISEWNVSNVETMAGMFSGDGPILNLDTGKEEERIPFNLDIGNWDVSSVTNMNHMFGGSNFNGDISRWNVSNVETMAGMFRESLFDGDISNWDVSKVRNMAGMFDKSRFTGDISRWNMSNVTNLESMFGSSALEDVGEPPAYYKKEGEVINDNFVFEFVQSYLSNDYKKDLQFIFEKNETAEKWLLRGIDLERVKARNQASASEDPIRNFVFSGVFLFQLLVYIILWDDEVHNERCKRTNEEPYENSFTYDNLVAFLENSGWADFGLDIYKEFTMAYPLCGLVPDGVHEVIDRYGLMKSMRKDCTHRFTLACVFLAMHGVLQTELKKLDIPDDVLERILCLARGYASEMLNRLFYLVQL
ncbi:conserved domain protein [Fibrobacter succinogenes subsp. succinogenes S85]|uniref:Conserved domain protein n=1 Tax=Fibrobacter succinogenes (strain ATCC 19169 / S85) TaxID=59374 RepID=C9RQX1_FIBSS|nr:BspA family leucine-rich repeat surface protein [Fibrobacter succinogenes]ACX74957.1 lipoprotein [Fibrobacter succinogenes subsp. succinogenes S85]ADL26675.1 conserved domain protein [Fibrobacter succinogenes subsp. succinogenes S85]